MKAFLSKMSNKPLDKKQQLQNELWAVSYTHLTSQPGFGEKDIKVQSGDLPDLQRNQKRFEGWPSLYLGAGEKKNPRCPKAKRA